MNCLKSYIDEQIRTIVYEDGVVATPGNTMGMGNPMAPTDTTPGSEPIVVGPRKKRKISKNKICTKIKESLLDDDDAFYDPKNDKNLIVDWIKSNYKITGKLTISDDFIVDCSGAVKVKNKTITSLTNGLFRWAKVGGDFLCDDCKNLTSLNGAPEEVEGDFDCSNCKNLISLEGGPKEVGTNFDCGNCDKLTSLEGAPEIVRGGFYCDDCKNLTSLKGAPKSVDDAFYCNGCENLTSLEGAPKEVGWDFYCGRCEKLVSLKGGPEKIDGSFVCNNCDSLKSLDGAPKKIKYSLACIDCKNLEITDSDRKKYSIEN